MRDDFVQLVKAMRTQQKAYFRTRSSFDLQRSKELERQVDESIDADQKRFEFMEDSDAGR